MDEQKKTSVAMTRCPDYDENLVRSAVREAVALIGGIGDIIRPGNKVLLKANLLAPSDPDDAVTTHPAVVKAVIEIVKEAGGVPVVADSPGYFYAGGRCRALTMCGLKDVADELGVDSMQFEAIENGFKKIDVPEGVYLKSIYAARLALEADVIVTLPKIKTHASTWYTGAIKNMFGAVATSTRKEAHTLATYERFSGSLVDVYSVFKPGLAIMDAIDGMEGEGPRHGKKRHLGLIIASKDPVAPDAAASKVIGFEPMEIFTTRDADARGFGNGNLDEIEVLGEKIADVKVDFEKPSGRRINMHPVVMKIGYRFLKVRPDCIEALCDKCGICAKSCPVNAITMNPYPEIDRDICIECYCCNEMCPTGAMEIKKNWLAKRLG